MSKNYGSTTVRASFTMPAIQTKGGSNDRLVYETAIIKKHTYGSIKDLTVCHPSFSADGSTHKEAKAKLHEEVTRYAEMAEKGVVTLQAHAAEVRQWLDDNQPDKGDKQ